VSAPWSGFSSVIGVSAQSYLDYKRALARKFLNEEMGLRLLDRFLFDEQVHELAAIDSALIARFLASRERRPARSYNHLLGVIRGFFEWLVLQEQLLVSPVQLRPRRAGTMPRPFLFEPAQVADLLERAKALPDNPRAAGRGRRYHLMFALMYALGLRVGEATRLRHGDVDLQRRVLWINDTKFSKDRLVPFGPGVGRHLENYLGVAGSRQGGSSTSDTPLFSFTGDRPVSRCSVASTFRTLVRDRYEIAPGVGAPRPHCLRHSFAVGTLLRWYRAGVDPNERLARLSTFLGHVDPASTAWYLTITSELLDVANERFERYAPIGSSERVA